MSGWGGIEKRSRSGLIIFKSQGYYSYFPLGPVYSKTTAPRHHRATEDEARNRNPTTLLTKCFLVCDKHRRALLCACFRVVNYPRNLPLSDIKKFLSLLQKWLSHHCNQFDLSDDDLLIKWRFYITSLVIAKYEPLGHISAIYSATKKLALCRTHANVL